MTDDEARQIAEKFFKAIVTDDDGARAAVRAVKEGTLDQLGAVIGKITSTGVLNSNDTKLVLSYVRVRYISREENDFSLFGPVAQSLIRH